MSAYAVLQTFTLHYIIKVSLDITLATSVAFYRVFLVASAECSSVCGLNGTVIDDLGCSAQIERRMELVRIVSHNTHKRLVTCLQGHMGTDAEKRHVRATIVNRKQNPPARDLFVTTRYSK